MHFRRRSLLLVGLLATLAISLRASGQEQTSAELLKARGLRKLNQSFVLPEETALTKKFHDTDALRRKVADSQQKAAAAEQKVEDKKAVS